MKSTMKAVIVLGAAGAATAASDPRREVIRFPFNMPKGHKPTGGFNFMANCYNFINAMSSADSNAHTLKCHADGSLCDAWANTLPDIIKAKHSGEAIHNKALSYNHWCDAVRLAKDPKAMPVANFNAKNHALNIQQHKELHDEHKVAHKAEQKVEQKAKVQLKAKAKVQQQEEAEHVRLAKQAQRLREQAEEARAKAAKAAQEAEDKKSVADMMKELSAKAKREVEERAKKAEGHGHKEALMAKTVMDTSDAKYQELVNKLEHKATAEAPKVATAPKAEKAIKHHGWDGVLATEDKMDAEIKAEHRGVRGGDFVQKASSPTHSESRIGHMMEEIYDDVASLVHRVV